MNCKICNSKSNEVKVLLIRGKYEAHYYLCDQCDFMFVTNPTWLSEAYQTPIDPSDTGYVSRNVYLSKKVLILFSALFGTDKKFLDYAGGYGMLTRLMRDYGLDFYNDDLYAKNLFAQSFEFKNQKIEAISCFECFEHLESPIEEIEKILKISKNVFFSTRLRPQRIPSDDWEYYGVNHGQHISLYSIKTFEYIAKKYNLYFYTNNDNLHLLTNIKISKAKFKVLLLLSKFQVDIIIKKFLNSKTTLDSIQARNNNEKIN